MEKDYDYKVPEPIEAHSKCHTCGKTFYIPDKNQYVYKRDEVKDGRFLREYFCSWSCLCKYDKEYTDKYAGYNPRLAFYCDFPLRKWIDEEAERLNLSISQTIVRALKAQKEAQDGKR